MLRASFNETTCKIISSYRKKGDRIFIKTCIVDFDYFKKIAIVSDKYSKFVALNFSTHIDKILNSL